MNYNSCEYMMSYPLKIIIIRPRLQDEIFLRV